MQVTFLRKHLDWNANDIANIDDGIAKYLIAMGVATDELPDNDNIDKVLKEKLKKAKKKA